MKKYNLIFVFADQWRRTATGFNNIEDVITPNIDSFSKEAKIFNNAVSVGPICSPSRASILTGKYPIEHGVFTNCKKGLNIGLKEDEITILDVLKQNNYYVGYIGKWHLDNPEINKEENPKSGAREWDAFTPKGKKRHGVDYWYSYGAYDNHLKPHYWHDTDEMIEVDKWSVEHETDKALEFLDKNKDKPFSLFLSWNPPHTPLDLVPEKYLKMYDGKDLRLFPNIKLNDVVDHPETMEEKLNFTKDSLKEALKKYYAAITGVDENFGRIIKYLKDNDLYDNTIVVLTADHGEMFTSHGLWSKHVWYEESIGIPFLIRKKGVKGESNVVLTSVDIMPTLLSMMDLKVPESVSGMSLKEEVEGSKTLSNIGYIAAYPGAIKAINQFNENNLNFLDYGWRAIRTKEHTYVVNKGYKPFLKEEKYLYDNINDPYQLRPITEETETSKELEGKLKNWLKKYKDNFKI